MGYFNEIIFPPLEKKVVEFLNNIPDHCYNELTYWFEFREDVTWFMVGCPICGEKYRYSIIQAETNPHGIYAGIEDNERYFKMEWEQNCPNREAHANIIALGEYYNTIGNTIVEKNKLPFDWDD